MAQNPGSFNIPELTRLRPANRGPSSQQRTVRIGGAIRPTRICRRKGRLFNGIAASFSHEAAPFYRLILIDRHTAIDGLEMQRRTPLADVGVDLFMDPALDGDREAH
jgi:hypothetical protein